MVAVTLQRADPDTVLLEVPSIGSVATVSSVLAAAKGCPPRVMLRHLEAAGVALATHSREALLGTGQLSGGEMLYAHAWCVSRGVRVAAVDEHPGACRVDRERHITAATLQHLQQHRRIVLVVGAAHLPSILRGCKKRG